MKVLDFSTDIDQEPDSNGEFTGATLKAGFLPESFTICLSIMVDAWTTSFSAADMFRLLGVHGYTWGMINLYAATTAPSYTEYEIWLGPLEITKTIPTVFFPLQWARACLSLDSIASKVRVVVDGQLLVEEEYRREEDEYRPANLSLVLGCDPKNMLEYTMKTVSYTHLTLPTIA